jgi:hypothetical protein
LRGVVLLLEPHVEDFAAKRSIYQLQLIVRDVCNFLARRWLIEDVSIDPVL